VHGLTAPARPLPLHQREAMTDPSIHPVTLAAEAVSKPTVLVSEKLGAAGELSVLSAHVHSAMPSMARLVASATFRCPFG